MLIPFAFPIHHNVTLTDNRFITYYKNNYSVKKRISQANIVQHKFYTTIKQMGEVKYVLRTKKT